MDDIWQAMLSLTKVFSIKKERSFFGEMIGRKMRHISTILAHHYLAVSAVYENYSPERALCDEIISAEKVENILLTKISGRRLRLKALRR